MAILSTPIRQQIWRGLMRFWSNAHSDMGALSKADIQAAANAADDWSDANAASFNTALPTAFKNNASAGQKSMLLAVVILARNDPALIRAIVGEVD